jgi:phosphoglycolate phosphatase-like HAD superfamily hydrolase
MQYNRGGGYVNYKAVFFDWDGVITDSVNVKTKAFAELYREYGADIEQKVVEYHLQHGGLSRFEKIKYFHRAYLNKNISEVELNELAAKFSGLVFNAVVNAEFIPGAVETITREFGKGTLLFVVSGTPTDEIRKIAEMRNLSRYFSEVVGSPTSKADIISRLMDEYSLESTECLMIGDALEDYRAARDNKIDFIGIASTSGEFQIDFPSKTTVQNEIRI